MNNTIPGLFWTAPRRRGGAAGEGGAGRHGALRGRQPQLRRQVSPACARALPSRSLARLEP